LTRAELGGTVFNMAINFSTDDLAARDRIPFWVDVASQAFYSHNFSTASGRFEGRLTSGVVDNIALTRVDCDPCAVSRSRLDTLRDDLDNYIFSIRLQGRSALSQGEETVIVEPGSVVLHNTNKPLKIEFLEKTSSLHVSVGRQLMRSRVGDIDAMRVLSRGAPTTGLAVDFILSLADRVAGVDAMLYPRIANQVVDLISMAIAADGGKRELSAPREVALRRLKTEIGKRLADPSLKPAQAASVAGMSVRYANMLLAEEGLSLERFIVKGRLERCRQALADPLQARRTIGDIAFAWGFSDHSHFTRRFRAAFGVTPAEYRAGSQAGKLRK